MTIGSYKQGGTANPSDESVIVPVNKGKAIIWLDPSDPSTIISKSGNELLEIADKANGLTYRADNTAPATGGPDHGTVLIGGLETLDFAATDFLRSHTGTGDPAYLDLTSVPIETNCVSFGYVFNCAGGINASYLALVTGPDSSDDILKCTHDDSGLIIGRVNNNNRFHVDQTTPAVPLNGNYILTGTITIPSKLGNSPQNTLLHSAEISGNPNFTTLVTNDFDGNPYWGPCGVTFGGRPSNNNLANPLNTNEQYEGRIGEFIMLKGYWDPQLLTGYLAHKWGLESGIPSSHPYKAAPPNIPSFV